MGENRTSIKQLRTLYPELFKVSIPDETAKMFETKEEKAKLLGLTDSRIKELKNMKVKEFLGDVNIENYNESFTNHIDMNKVVGYGNHNIKTWYDALDSSVCHKRISFDKYDKSKFEIYIDSERDYDLPSVVEYNGEYYIHGGGTHRLTIAKLTGCKHAYVVVHKKK